MLLDKIIENRADWRQMYLDKHHLPFCCERKRERERKKKEQQNSEHR